LASELARNRVNLFLNARGEALLGKVAAAARERGVDISTVVGDAALANNAEEMVLELSEEPSVKGMFRHLVLYGEKISSLDERRGVKKN
jgi:short-subunit dehydrogenase